MASSTEPSIIQRVLAPADFAYSTIASTIPDLLQNKAIFDEMEQLIENLTNSTSETMYDPHVCDFKHGLTTYMIMFIFTVIFILSVIGNLLVILVIIQQRAMRSITNIYLMNLAVTDLLLSVICMPPTLIQMVTGCWIIGGFACKLFAYLQPVVVTASAYTLAVIAFERYFAICQPLHSRIWQTRSHAYLMISLVWILSFLVNTQIFLQIGQAQPETGGIFCANLQENRTIIFINQIYVTIVLLVVPLFVMTYLYGNVIHCLRQGIRLDIAAVESSGAENDSTAIVNNCTNNNCDNNNIVVTQISNGSANSHHGSPVSEQKLSVLQKLQQKLHLNVKEKPKRKLSQITMSQHRRSETSMLEASLRSTHHHKNTIAKQRVIKMLIVVVIIFFCCWSPSYIYFLVVTAADAYDYEFKKEIAALIWHPDVYTLFTILTYLSSCTNPITYCFLNKKFRTSVYAIFGRKKILRQHFQKIYMPIRDKDMQFSQLGGQIAIATVRQQQAQEKIHVARTMSSNYSRPHQSEGDEPNSNLQKTKSIHAAMQSRSKTIDAGDYCDI